ncbi:unnamed protein product [Polarella glacialis]|uniref:Uncharacterized protein n=1 Tax=Polarella glacialis TaxID=89957 RepID=A0A813I5W5_POLGL|nr:unnamed protein product [Polarella glacialis]
MLSNHATADGLQWEVQDVRNLALGSPVAALGPFDGAVEKGCLDALLCSSEAEASSYIGGLASLLAPGAKLLIVSNSPARHRHLTAKFEVQEVTPVFPQDGPFGPSLYVCRARGHDITPVDSDEEDRHLRLTVGSDISSEEERHLRLTVQSDISD